MTTEKPIKLYPDNVHVVMEYNGIRLKSEPMYGGDVANMLFRKSPYARAMIKEMQPGDVKPMGMKSIPVTVIVAITDPKEHSSRRDAAGRGPRAPSSGRENWNPLKNRPYINEAERDEVLQASLAGELKVELPADDGEADSKEVALYEINEADEKAKPTGTLCTQCRKKLYKTTQGTICPNGHWKGKHL